MSAGFEISVVTPTYNRKERLLRVLSALGRQSVRPDAFEVVIVDDGSRDGTSQAVSSLSLPYSTRVFRQENGGPARARNRGVEEARGRMVLFLDDDVEPAPNLVAEHLRSHARESGQVAVMGPLSSLPHYAQPWVSWEQAKLEAQYRAMASGEFAPTFRQFWTGNASVARAEIVESGGFNTEFLRGEDVELGRRLGARGVGFRFNPDAIGLHHAERSLDSWSHAHESYGRLEVQIFGGLGEGALLDTLASNYGRLHPATRLVLGACLRQPRVRMATVRALRAWLLSPGATRVPQVSDKVCSVLANVLYWQASAEALGGERFATVMARTPS